MISHCAMRLCRQVASLAIVGFLSSSGVANASGTDDTRADGVDAIVARVQARLDDAADFRADVSQEAVIAALDRAVSATGTVVFKRPGKMRWDFAGEDAQIIVSDGTTLWFYQPADEQVLKAPLESVFRSSTPVSFLTGVGKINEDLSVAVESQDAVAIGLLLDPKRSGGDLGRLELVVDAATHDIVEARVTDPMGNLTTLKFSNLRRNTGVADGEFDFQVPPGVDVVEAPLGY